MICTPFTGCPVKGVHIRTGRLFLCLVIALRTYGITKSKASNTQADDGYKKIRRKHAQALHSQDFCKQISM